MTQLYAFDLDGTLAESKSPIDSEMAGLLCKLLEKYKVAVISGGPFEQLKKQVNDQLPCSADTAKISNLLLLPQMGGTYFKLLKDGEGAAYAWHSLYSNPLNDDQKEKIFNALKNINLEFGINTLPSYGDRIQDRGSQITLSVLGQQAPADIKRTWDPDEKKRIEMTEKLKYFLPEFEITIGGMTSIDITPKGIDKEYALKKIMEIEKIEAKDIEFAGDALFEGGNDFPATKAGVTVVKVENVADTKIFIASMLQ